jgi:hypothetical protein
MPIREASETVFSFSGKARDAFSTKGIPMPFAASGRLALFNFIGGSPPKRPGEWPGRGKK